MCLVNGADGIGTGWSTDVPCYNPRDICSNLRLMMDGYEPKPMHPWYKGFQGAIERLPNDKSYLISGIYCRLSETELEITELPIGKWTRDYKTNLEEMAQQNDFIANISEYHQENRVHFVLEIPSLETMSDAEIVKKFKLQTSIPITNLVLFNKDAKIHRYATELDIMKEFFRHRQELYTMRKEFMLATL